MVHKFGPEEVLARLRGIGTIGGGERRDAPLSGTKALSLALLEDGINAYLGKASRPRAEAEAWVRQRGEKSRWVFSFVTICEQLGLDPDAVEKVLRQMRREGNVVRLSRSRANVRSTNRVRESRKGSKIDKSKKKRRVRHSSKRWVPPHKRRRRSRQG